MSNTRLTLVPIHPERPNKTYKKFTKQDNQTLLNLHKELSRYYKSSDLWKVIGERMGRTSRNVRDHFKKFSTQSNASWTQEEDELILRKVEEIGRKWADIAGLLKNRSSQNVYTRYRNLISKARPKYQGTQVISKSHPYVQLPSCPPPVPFISTDIFSKFVPETSYIPQPVHFPTPQIYPIIVAPTLPEPQATANSIQCEGDAPIADMTDTNTESEYCLEDVEEAHLEF